MKNTLSRIAGKIACTKFPQPMQKSLNRLFVYITKINLRDFSPIASYKSIQELFTRELQSERLLPSKKNALISPCDATLLHQGDIRKGQILQVKGYGYKVVDLLSPQFDGATLSQLEGGIFMNFYLAPHDYHHFHAPTDLQILRLVHVPGTLASVQKKCQEKTPDLFIRNERVILECEMENKKKCFFVAVGALNVGKIRIKKEPRLQTNLPGKNLMKTYTYKNSLHIKRGEDLGFFEMGSSVVLLFEKDCITLHSATHNDQILRFGDAIGEILP